MQSNIKNKINFTNQVIIHHYPIQSEINLQINSQKYKPHLASCHKAQYLLAHLLNSFSKHKINLIGVDEEAIKIVNINKPWYEDDSSIVFLN